MKPMWFVRYYDDTMVEESLKEKMGEKVNDCREEALAVEMARTFIEEHNLKLTDEEKRNGMEVRRYFVIFKLSFTLQNRT
ncbi:MAG: hypothetical protein PHU42_01950 [Patescibacteria group bacterium]|nr:hypothetical protein [Patescibacteria group bacterium]